MLNSFRPELDIPETRRGAFEDNVTWHFEDDLRLVSSCTAKIPAEETYIANEVDGQCEQVHVTSNM